MDLVNLCPHEIDLRLGDGEEIVLPSAGAPARVVERADGAERVPIAVNGHMVEVPVTTVEMGETVALPPPRPGVLYVVSFPVAYAHPERDDLLVPDDLVRDEHGRVVACQRLARMRPQRAS
jgi:hypothetical protein